MGIDRAVCRRHCVERRGICIALELINTIRLKRFATSYLSEKRQ